MKKCKCGKETITGRCKSCSNRDRAGEYKHKVNNRRGMKFKTKGLMNNEKNPMWKGDEVGLKALHEWIRDHKLKPKFCERCKKNKPYDLANISGEYKRDINDFEWLCRKCHMESDGRLNNLKQFKNG